MKYIYLVYGSNHDNDDVLSAHLTQESADSTVVKWEADDTARRHDTRHYEYYYVLEVEVLP